MLYCRYTQAVPHQATESEVTGHLGGPATDMENNGLTAWLTNCIEFNNELIEPQCTQSSMQGVNIRTSVSGKCLVVQGMWLRCLKLVILPQHNGHVF